MPEAIVALGAGKRIVGRLRFDSDGRRQYSQFEYAEEWLVAHDSFPLSPGLPLRPGSHFNSGRTDRQDALSGCFSDAAPDAWGRSLMTRALGAGLTEFDFLVRSDDRTRQGALRFLDEGLQPLSDSWPPVPRLLELDRIRSLAQRFERDPAAAGVEALDLAGVAGSLGGARPKANVEGEGHLWIAKFTSTQDTRPVERVEVATLKLATQCGLRAATARLELANSDHPVALVRRFDRRGDARVPYLSARSALDWRGDEAGYYTDIADVVRQWSPRPLDDLHELWRRIVFTILVSNTDDHLKNHGFLYAGRQRWRLAPAFDINPSPARQRTLATGIARGASFDASLDAVLEASRYFELLPAQARGMALEMATLLSRHWRRALRREGCSADEARSYEDAFEHDEAHRALTL